MIFSNSITWTENSVERNNRIITEYLIRKNAESIKHREAHWNRNFSNPVAYNKSVEKNRKRFRFITGIRDDRVSFESPELCGTLNTSACWAETSAHKIYTIRWPVFEDFWAEGLFLEPIVPEKTEPAIIHVPHSGTSPEQLLGLEHCESDPFFVWPQPGQRMIIPALIDRTCKKRLHVPWNDKICLTNREYIYRAAFQLGRHIIGYEVQEVLALVDWLKKDGAGVCLRGHGEGGLIAFYAAAADTRIDEVLVADYFNNRDRLCDEPIDHNVFGLLDQFGDAEIAGLVFPRTITIVQYNAPELTLTPDMGGAPGHLTKPEPAVVKAEIERAKKLTEKLNIPNWITYREIPKGSDTAAPRININGKVPVPSERIKRLVRGMERHNQTLLDKSVLTRKEFWNKLDETSLETIEKTIEWYRDYFMNESVGKFDDPYVDPNVRTRLFVEDEKWTAYEVELDVFDGLSAYGILMIPKDMKEGEKRPVIVCQHGLEREAKSHIKGCNYPGETIFTSELCERGYICFAPQGIFTLAHRFRFTQRLANPLGKNMFSIMAAQHQQIVNWLQSLPIVKKDKIGLYGVSYGGTTVMEVTPFVKEYALGICSANFNYWNYDCANILLDRSYIFNEHYEIFHFDLANTFDHSDMARLIAPRTFMVERGHLDGVASSEYVGFEFGKVRYYYDHCLKMPDRAEIKWIDGGHTVYVDKTAPFLDTFLREI
ncbi:hypothetical protein FACS1894163_04180 [Spirochaetia bacterium]|nr:hypothetical protein FACS1894163_04180 [Spirochaetia bacterium]